jgi:hypothetical protein
VGSNPKERVGQAFQPAFVNKKAGWKACPTRAWTLLEFSAMRSSLAIALLLATACASTPPAPQPQPQPAAEPAATRPSTPGAVPILARGVSCNSAVIIDATNEHDGIAQENAWINENYPGAKKVSQELITCNKKPADQIDIETANGVKRSVYFDISNFFGKH